MPEGRELETEAGRLTLLGPVEPRWERVLDPAALGLVAGLARTFGPRVRELLARRAERRARWDAGERPDFLPGTAEVRAGDWNVAPVPADLQDRRVEITGPVSRKLVINALNSGARVFMADFEDATTPTWENLMDGQANLVDAVRRTLAFEDAATGKRYALGERTAVLMVRPRGWHLPEWHVRLDGEPVPGALLDFGLYLALNARELLARGTGPYFYLPKLESHLEARLWNDVFLHAQRALGLPVGTIRATVLIETLPAAFEMDEILFELRDHSAGLNCGRWDYIFSFTKTFRADPAFVLPERGQVGMTQPFMKAYTELVIRTCHRRRVHAMGGMAAQIPIKGDEAANRAALDRVAADKLREVTAGHDGTWVAHPALVPLATAIFDEHLPTPNQIHRRREDVSATAADLIRVPEGTRTLAGLRGNLSVGVQYLAAWLGGNGCVPLHHLMEDAATAEISRTQVWQWLRHGARLDDGRVVDRALVEQTLDGVMAELRSRPEAAGPAADHLDEACALFTELSTAEELADFLTIPAYERILRRGGPG